MAEKKYLLTESELQDISDYYDCNTCAPMMRDAEWLEAHEYHERTCHVIPDGCIGRCSACGDDVFADPEYNGGFCPACGAKVIS